ncbi:MAG: tryptophan--tRNA ligase [Clostridia bacterium]|nr:tryptophan--tRNA ligase [Clostridia bacterium]
MRKRILTGIKPTGYAHIGNFFGAIKPAIELAQNSDFDCFYFIADYHALTTLETKQEMQEYLYNIACTWLACGLDPEKVVFYKQSDVPEVFELNWILCNVTAKGLMNRAHAYKAVVEKNSEQGNDLDYGVNMGLYNYPILMAADILLYGANLVPVGLDQKQHIEIARDIAGSFNKKYGKALVLPEEYIQENTHTLVGLDGRKMSKSYGNTIQLFTTEEVLKKTVNKIVTDSRMPGEPKEKDCTIAKLYKLFASKEQSDNFENQLENGLGWGDAKKQLFEVMNEYIKPMREKFFYYQQNKQLVDEILEKGAKRAKTIAKDNLDKVKQLIGAK